MPPANAQSLQETFNQRFSEEDAITPPDEIPRAFRVKFEFRSCFAPLNDSHHITTQWKHLVDHLHHGRDHIKSMKVYIDWLQDQYKKTANDLIVGLQHRKRLLPLVHAVRRGGPAPETPPPPPPKADAASPAEIIKKVLDSPEGGELASGAIEHLDAALQIIVSGALPMDESGPPWYDSGRTTPVIAEYDDSFCGLEIDELSNISSVSIAGPVVQAAPEVEPVPVEVGANKRRAVAQPVVPAVPNAQSSAAPPAVPATRAGGARVKGKSKKSK